MQLLPQIMYLACSQSRHNTLINNEFKQADVFGVNLGLIMTENLFRCFSNVFLSKHTCLITAGWPVLLPGSLNPPSGVPGDHLKQNIF